MSGGKANVPRHRSHHDGRARLGRGAAFAVARELVHERARASRSLSPATPADAKGLLRTAIRGEDPVLFFEHKMLYATKGRGAGRRASRAFGQATVLREGKDVTIIAIGGMVQHALAAADELARGRTASSSPTPERPSLAK